MNNLITFFIILYAVVCLLLILLVIIQGGKAEGLFASAQANVLGSRGTDVLTKLTTVLAAVFIIGALLISVMISSQRSVFEKVENAPQSPNTTAVQTNAETQNTAPSNTETNEQ